MRYGSHKEVEVIPALIVEEDRDELPPSDGHVARRAERCQVLSGPMPVVKHLHNLLPERGTTALAVLSSIKRLLHARLEGWGNVYISAPAKMVLGQLEKVAKETRGRQRAHPAICTDPDGCDASLALHTLREL